MKQAITKPNTYQNLRKVLQDLCKIFDSTYCQEVDEARGYPEHVQGLQRSF